MKAEASVWVACPPGRVWEFVARPENLTRFLSNVRVRRLWGALAEWQVPGPLGIPVCWRVATSALPGRLLTWQAAEGPVRGGGRVALEPHGGGCRVSVGLDYCPQAGVLGDVFDGLFRDPQAQLEADLRRLADLLSDRTPVPADGDAGMRVASS